VKRARLGTWTTPSGNSVDVFIGPAARSRHLHRHLHFEWDRFPLTPSDEIYYVTAILPTVTKLAREYLEIVGPAVVVVR